MSNLGGATCVWLMGWSGVWCVNCYRWSDMAEMLLWLEMLSARSTVIKDVAHSLPTRPKQFRSIYMSTIVVHTRTCIPCILLRTCTVNRIIYFFLNKGLVRLPSNLH